MQRSSLNRRWLVSSTAALAVFAIGAVSATPAALAADTIVGLITKTATNPFFVKMKEGALAKAAELGVELRTFAGKDAADMESQVLAIESLIAAGARGFLIVPGDTAAMVAPVKKARDAGLLVIALDTALDPIDAADATFATDNFLAGKLIGEWAAKSLGAGAASAKIALIDENENQSTVDVQRDQGFLTGFGIDVGDPKRIGDEKDSRVVGHALGYGAEDGGRTAMENLLQKDPGVNVVYTINEPTAAGAYEALKAAGKTEGVLIVSVDGACPGVKNVAAGVIGATAMQFPLLMASIGVEAIAEFAKSGKKPEMSPGLQFFNTGVNLITDKPVGGLDSLTSAEGLKRCWG
ncbi:MAG: substrate-binding domain-containing protein [Bauldia sp.]